LKTNNITVPLYETALMSSSIRENEKLEFQIIIKNITMTKSAKMKLQILKQSLSFLFIVLIISGCKKDKIEIQEEYSTKTVISQFNTSVIVSGKNYGFRGGEAYFFSYPGIKYPTQFSFSISIPNESSFEYLTFKVPSTESNPQRFFSRGSFHTNYLEVKYIVKTKDGVVTYSGDYQNADVEFIWHSISFQNNTFSGKGSLVIKNFLGPVPNCDYILSPQVISFEF